MRKLTGLLALGLASAIAAQTPCYTVDYGTPIGHGDDVVLPLQSIGFSFEYDGLIYADFYASTNGFLYLRNGPSATPLNAWCCGLGFPSRLLINTDGPIIAPFWTDVDMRVANEAKVYVNRQPSVCIITWHNAVEYGEPPSERFHAQVKLFQSGEILFSYTDTARVRGLTPALVGISPGNNAPDPGPSDFTFGGTSVAGTMYDLFTSGGARPFDLMQRTVLMSPIGPNMADRQYDFSSAPCPEAGGVANKEYYGEGCVARYHSVYEWFAVPSTFDLANSTMGMVNLGNGFTMNASPAPFILPSPSATQLALGNNDEVAVSLTTPFNYHSGSAASLVVCSNGFVSLGANNGTFYSADPGYFLSRPDTLFANWHDYDPSLPGSGQIYFEEVGNVAYVTWLGVYTSYTTSPDTFQFQFELATGDVRLVWLSMSAPPYTTPYLVGYSEGGLSLDPGMRDLSAELPAGFFVPAGAEYHPLGIEARGYPYPGNTVALDATNLPANTAFGAIALGLTRYDPGLELSAIGMPGCFQYNDAIAVRLFFSPATGTQFNAPTGINFLGVQIQAQASAYAPGLTPLGFIASNGVELLLGT